MFQDWRRCGPHFFPLFRRRRGLFRKYVSGAMICTASSVLPMRYSRLSLFMFVKDRDAVMSHTQAVSFSIIRNICIEQFSMTHPRQVLRPEI